MSADDIDQVLGDRLSLLPTDTGGDESFDFTADSVPEVPKVMRSDRLVVTKGFHTYNGYWRADSLSIFATKPTLRGLGMIAMSALFFSKGETLELELTHPGSEIRFIRVGAPWDDDALFVRQPSSYSYFPSLPARDPWLSEAPEPRDLPSLLLTDKDEVGGVTVQDWLERDTVVGFGSAWGTARMASLFLDIGNPINESNEFRMEGENGCRGVAPASAEARIWLPGSLGWNPDYQLD